MTMPNTRSPEGLSCDIATVREALSIAASWATKRRDSDNGRTKVKAGLDAMRRLKDALNTNTGGGELRHAAEQVILGFDSVHGPNRDDAIQGLREALAALSTQDAPKEDLGTTPFEIGSRVRPVGAVIEGVLLEFSEPCTGALVRWDNGDEVWMALCNLEVVTTPTPDQGEASPWRHAANEWADMATSGLQWLRNIRDGVSTVEEALANMAECLAHCRAVSKDVAAPPITVEGES